MCSSDLAASKLVAKEFNMDPALAQEAMANMIEPHMWSEGEISLVELNRIADGLKLIGEISETPDWATLIDQSFLPADVRAGQ